MFEIKGFRVRSAMGKAITYSKEITLPSKWIKQHGIEIGDELSMVLNNILVVIPPGLTEEEEERIFKFVRRGEE